MGEEIEQRGVMTDELCCRRGKERRKMGECVGEGTSNEGVLGGVHRRQKVGRQKREGVDLKESVGVYPWRWRRTIKNKKP